MRDMVWMPGAELEEDNMYGNQMPKEHTMFVCNECGALNKHLTTCSENDKGTHYTKNLKVPERVDDDQCEYCRAPAGLPHHPDCPDE